MSKCILVGGKTTLLLCLIVSVLSGCSPRFHYALTSSAETEMAGSLNLKNTDRRSFCRRVIDAQFPSAQSLNEAGECLEHDLGTASGNRKKAVDSYLAAARCGSLEAMANLRQLGVEPPSVEFAEGAEHGETDGDWTMCGFILEKRTRQIPRWIEGPVLITHGLLQIIFFPMQVLGG